MEDLSRNSEANSEVGVVMYSVRELAEMRLTGLPDTERAWLDRAKNGKWAFKEVPGRGRGGVKRIYMPPPEIMALIEARQRGELTPAERPLLTKPELASLSKEDLGGAPAHYAQNPNAQFEAMLKRVAEASQATVRISKQFDGALPVEWTSLIQELMSMHGLTEAGAKRVIEALKQQT